MKELTDAMGDEDKAELERVKKAYEGTDADALEEYWCNRFGELLENPEALRKFSLDLVLKNAGLGRRVLIHMREFIQSILDRRGGKDTLQERRLRRADQMVGKILDSLERGEGTQNEGTRPISYLVTSNGAEDAKALLDDFINGKIARNDGSIVKYAIPEDGAEKIINAATYFVDEFSAKKIDLPNGHFLYFAPDSRTVASYDGDIAKAWAEYALHLVTHSGKNKDGEKTRFYDKAKIPMIFNKLNEIIAEDKVLRDGNRIIFLKQEGNKYLTVVSEMDQDGNLVANLRYITGLVQKGKSLQRETTTLLEATADRPNVGRLPAPAADNPNITPDGISVKNSVTPAEDAEYMDAVKTGDMETAGRMVREAAGNPEVVYRGDAEKFYSWDGARGALICFTLERREAEAYARRAYERYGGGRAEERLMEELRDVAKRNNQAEIRRVMAELNDLEGGHTGEYFLLTDRFARWDQVRDLLCSRDFEEYLTTLQGNDTTGKHEKASIASRILDFFRRRNVDGGKIEAKRKDVSMRDLAVIDSIRHNASRLYWWENTTVDKSVTWNEIIAPYLMENGFDGIEYPEDGANITRAIFAERAGLFKSADPVTYDDAGNVIPLSQRFNPANDDIRYSVTENPETAQEPSDLDAVSAFYAPDQVTQIAVFLKPVVMNYGADAIDVARQWLEMNKVHIARPQDVDYVLQVLSGNLSVPLSR